MSIHKRYIQRLIEDRIAEPEGKIQILIGPRQVGKTTAIKGAQQGRGVYASADSPSTLTTAFITEHWHQAAQSSPAILALDEIQKVPGWSEEIKRLWDNGPKLAKVILTGSASLLLEKGLRESLAGRFELIRAEHWNASEARECFALDLKTFVEFGCYPGAVQFLPEPERWAAYVRDAIIEPAIGRDILQLHPVENPALLRQLLGVVVSLPAQVISLQKIQGQLQVKGAVATISHYLSLLSHAFLISGLQKYTANEFRSRQSSPKLIAHDNAIIRAFERPTSEPIGVERFGRYLENAVGARLLEAGWDVYYWRERALEVDFVAISPAGERLAIEVKTHHPPIAELNGLREFCKRYPTFRPCLITPKSAQYAQSVHAESLIKDIIELPAEDVLSLNWFQPSSVLDRGQRQNRRQ